MDLVALDPELNLYDPQWPIRTVPLLAPPPKFILSEPDRTGLAIDSIVSPGSIVSGGRVMHSVISASVRINSWALVEDSILFDKVQVGRGAKIRRAIVDVNIMIPEGEEIGYDLDKDRKRFMVTGSGIVVVTNNGHEQQSRSHSG